MERNRQAQTEAVRIDDAARDAIARGDLHSALAALRRANPGLRLRDASRVAKALKAGLPEAATHVRDRAAQLADRRTLPPVIVDHAAAAGSRPPGMSPTAGPPGAVADAAAELRASVADALPEAVRPGSPHYTPTVAPGDGGSQVAMRLFLLAVSAGVAVSLWWIANGG